MDLAQIKQEISEYEKGTIQIAEELEFSQADLIKKIIYYHNSHFLTGDYDDQGDRKYFFNINRNPCDVCTKAIDFDTKDINIQTASGGNPLRTWFLQRDLKFWMKDQNFGKVLNRIFYELPIFGSVVLKVLGGKPYFVDLRNFVVQQDADVLNKAGYIIETHTYTPLVFKKIAQEKGWTNWKKVLDKSEKEIKVYERYGEDEDLNYRRTIIADEDVVLDDDIVDDHPYWEFHLDKISGRWLGVGRVELVLDPQIRTNELTNQQVKSSYYSALRLWQTRDQGVRRNLLTDAVNGQVLQVEEEIKQVDMADRNLSFYQVEINRWLANKDEMTFSHEVTRGERLPAGTPLGSARLAAGMAGAYFAQIQENIALDIKEFLFKVIIPQFLKENSKEHILRIAGEDLDKVNALLINNRLNKKQVEMAKRGELLFGEKRELMKSIIAERVKEQKELLIKIPAGFYKDLKYKIDIIITGEALDTRTQAANRFAILQAITADPTMLTDPIKRKIMLPVLEQAGISIVDLEPTMPSLRETVGQAAQRGAGGGVSKPTFAPTPVSGEVETKV